MAAMLPVFAEEVYMVAGRIERFHETGGIESCQASPDIIKVENRLILCYLNEWPVILRPWYYPRFHVTECSINTNCIEHVFRWYQVVKKIMKAFRIVTIFKILNGIGVEKCDTCKG